MKKNMNNKGGFTLIEMVAVITIIIILMFVLYPKIMGGKQKAEDTGRIKTAQNYAGYYETAKSGLGVYPSGGITNVGAAGSERALAKAVNTGPMTKGYYALFDFSGDRDDQGFYNTTPLKDFQTFLKANQNIAPSSIATLPEGEKMIIFTSKTAKRMVGCVKTFSTTEASSKDGDGIPNDKDPNGPDSSKNGNRIYVFGDMGLWTQLNGGNNATGEATRKCQDELVDPKEL